MPSASHNLFIMGFIHIYKFASNKSTVLKLAHFIAARKTAILYQDFARQWRTHVPTLIRTDAHLCVYVQAGCAVCTSRLLPAFWYLNPQGQAESETDVKTLASADTWRRVLDAVGCGTHVQREQEQTGGPWGGGHCGSDRGTGGKGSQQGKTRPGGRWWRRMEVRRRVSCFHLAACSLSQRPERKDKKGQAWQGCLH